jgi:hypothetical protein
VPPSKKSPPRASPHQYLHGIFRSNAGELYALKRSAFEALLAEQGSSLARFAERVFGKNCFQGTSIPKAELVVQLLKDELSPTSWRLIRDRLRDNPFLTDRRHTEEYAFDVALGWLEEELIIDELHRRLPEGVSIERIGIDRAREFLSLSIRATADLSVSSAHRRLLIDIFVDHKSTWRANGGMDLKQGKLGHFARGQLDYVLGLDLVARRFYLVDSAAAIGAPTFANAAMGGTETARIPLGKAMTFAGLAKRVGTELKPKTSNNR